MEHSNQNPDQQNPESDSNQQEMNTGYSYKDFEITEDIAKKMMEHRNKPGVDLSNIIDYNDAVMKQLKGVYPSGNITMEEARYRKEDEERYCRLRGIKEEPDGTRGKKGKVENHKTKIYKVTLPDKPAGENVYYYDTVTIKPPPYDPPSES